ncbi:MAG TPA: DinB family protein [Kineosporiaceae bacterium]|nr:DinB family protein [Kineosporiaceae bacterium]
MSLPFPGPTTAIESRGEVLLGYLDYFRSQLVTKLHSLPEAELRSSRLPTGWTPIQLLKHLTQVEVRWLEWGFEGREVAEPWADWQDGRWYVSPEENLTDLVAALHTQAARSRAVVLANDLAAVGQPGERWDGAEPATLERILLHLVQEYARHLGQLDIVCELAGGAVGE